MSIDFATRAIALRTEASRAFGSRLDHLRRGIDRAGLRLPGVMAAPPTIAAPNVTSAVSGTLYALYVSGVATNTAKYSLLRGSWRPALANFPQYNFGIADAVTRGTSPFDTLANRNTNKYDNPGNSYVRFWTTSPDFEIQSFLGAQSGYRLRVDGEYVQSGCLATGYTSSSGGHYQRITWGDGSAAYRKPRLYEIEPLQQWKFGGIKCSALDAPYPAPVPDRLKGLVHGDSFASDTGATTTALHAGLGNLIALLLGQPDTIMSAIGSTGFIWNGAGYNNFMQRVDLDVIPYAPDFIVELGGLNDNLTVNGVPAVFQAVYTQWLDIVQAALPDTLIFAVGPMTPGTATANVVAVRDGKKAACFGRRNVFFIDNIAEAWVAGTGKASASTGNGNADWITGGADGTDGTHPTPAGHLYLAQRVAHGIAAALKA